MSNKQTQRKTVAVVALVLGVLGVATIGFWNEQSSQTVLTSAKDDGSMTMTEMVAGELVEIILRMMADLGLSMDDEEEEDEMDELAELEGEIEALAKALEAMEKDVNAIKKSADSLAEVSGFTIDEFKPGNGVKLAGKVIEFRGRTRYTMSFKIEQHSIIKEWGNIILVGDTSGSIRSPGVWFLPNSRGLHIRQRAETDNGDLSKAHTWNRGCDVATSEVPAVGTQYSVKIVADLEYWTVLLNDREVCRERMDVLPPPGQQTVWIGRPGHVADATVQDMKFEIL